MNVILTGQCYLLFQINTKRLKQFTTTCTSQVFPVVTCLSNFKVKNPNIFIHHMNYLISACDCNMDLILDLRS